MKTAVIGFPRVGKNRELKFASEKFFKGEINEKELIDTAKSLRKDNWLKQKEAGIDYISVNDFSFYDNVLDVAYLFNIIPERYASLGLGELETYFAMARGYQGNKGNVKALAMKKWFNTNYHYIVPEIDDNADIRLVRDKPVAEFEEAKSLGIDGKVNLIGPFTLLKLARYTGSKNEKDFADALTSEYIKLISNLSDAKADLVQLEEPYLVKDLITDDIKLFEEIYSKLLSKKGQVKILLQTYFGDIRDIYDNVTKLDFDGIGLDFLEGRKTLELVKTNGFPADKLLFAGLVNGKNIWSNNFKTTLETLAELKATTNGGENIVLSTSCSLLHVPYTLDSETKLSKDYTKHFAFAYEKLNELKTIAVLSVASNPDILDDYKYNQSLFTSRVNSKDEAVQKRVAAIKDEDYTRLPDFHTRETIQKEKLSLPLFPTTTIGSFPQTADVRKNRQEFRKGLISEDAYKDFNKKKISECIQLQEEIGFDVLVHGEYERNDMVEYFGEHLDGYVFTEKAWVQSYGTRCVKPPIIWGDVSRKSPITVAWSKYANSCT
ncbi:MAG: 5-methyltetrahydropteroyltriglutamate--homocysteine S-methyltransferase, partial [Pseudobutyrivibrio sp.]|nr:5-methyltetrahydropteroyltriglutamate--homocysteine S-methyltransferase [Pseudobutyrivibrio sp.]